MLADVDRSEPGLAEELSHLIESGRATPAAVKSRLARVEPRERDAFIDRAFGLGPPPDDGPELPRGCVPYLPCPVDALGGALDLAAVGPEDVVVDIGSGAGRTAALVQLLTGATVLGVEVQRSLAEASRALMERLSLRRFAVTEGDVLTERACLQRGNVFFMYCPFGGSRLPTLLGILERVAETREIRVCCVDLPLPPCPWLSPLADASASVAVYRSGRRECPAYAAFD